ncbi:AAA family ATPase [Micromonospora chaiyaphumensis]|uniref:AAA ATPase domain-containing protein n=1 Tax=Micromonospora chaiyaphumensis TaxID=307119 RepID=A0A1C4UHA9_9ACTN|nr:adenylate/guanylate cyclase domain-containing protein [Micromonospora chaiyaphumensis]SCE71058.1 AAA ATPase domain-containing protein [Micromonospora chaiyaphumensis]
MLITTPVESREAATVVRWPVPEERRTVTVLFADIVGSTGLVERLDPEDVRALQRAYFGTVAAVLRRWHGVVEKYVGDAVMALFGAHGSDGFDAYRAVRAGLEIQGALDRRLPAATRLRVRVGVATGEVLVDLAAIRDGGHGAASGAVITTAARLQEYAPPGGVVVCAATRRAVAGLVAQRPLAAMTVAGRAAPLDVWRVTGPAPHRPSRHHGPLVGRRRELATAGDEIARAVRERRPRWISLVGPAGSGRSRLLHELVRAVSTVDGARVRWCVTHCPPFPDGDLAPLADLVRGLAGLGDTRSPETVRRRLGAALDGLLPAARRGAASHALAEFLAAPRDTGAALRGAEVCREVLLDLAAGQPVVVAVDDLDRAAPALNRFLHRLFATASERGLPLAVVATHGPRWADLLPGAAGRRRRVPLPALGTVDTGRLLRHLLDRAGRSAAPAAALLPLVGGNPAAAAAYVATLGADGQPAGVPEPVRRLVDARLDRLDGEQRAVLMAAAAREGDVPADTVARMLGWAAGRTEPVLGALADAGLLRRTATGGYAVAEPAVARVAAHRLPRAVRAEFVRRLRDTGTAGAVRPAVAGPGGGVTTGRATCPAGTGRRSGGGARPAPVPVTAGPAPGVPAAGGPLPAAARAAGALPGAARAAGALPGAARTGLAAADVPSAGGAEGVPAGGGAAAGGVAPGGRAAVVVGADGGAAGAGRPAGVPGGASAGGSATAGRPTGVPGGASAGGSGAPGLPAVRSGGNRAGRPVRARLGVFPGLHDALPGGPPPEPAGRVGPVGGRPPTVGPPRPRRVAGEPPAAASGRAGRTVAAGVPVLAA